MNEEKDLLRKLYHKIPKNIWVCFVAGIVFGVMTHLYMLTNKLPNWDDMNNLYGFGSGVGYGRWFLQYLGPFMGYWSVPTLHGMLAIVLWSIAGCFIVLALKLESMTSSVLVALMMLTFPSVACTMTFMFTVNCYAFGILLVCFGAYCYCNFKHGYIVASIAFILSLAIYQSFICLGAAIIVMALLLDLLKGNAVKSTLLNALKALITLIVTMIIYMISTRIFNHGVFSEDRGVDTMGQLPLTKIPRLIARAYKRISEYFVLKPYSFISTSLYKLNVLVCILIIVLILAIAIYRKLWKDKLRIVLIMGFAVMVPLALASIYILAPETQDASMLMLHQYLFIYVMLIALGECGVCIINDKASEKDNSMKRKTLFIKGISMIATIGILLVGYSQYILTNEAYFRTSVAFGRVEQFYNRVLSSIERQPGFVYGDDMALLGTFYETQIPVASFGIDDEKFVDMSGIAMENGLITEGIRAKFLRTYMGIQLTEFNAEQIEEIKEKEEYQQMPLYPLDGSIQKIDGVWVVKLADDEKDAVIE